MSGTKDYRDLIRAVSNTPGWEIKQGRRHYRITGPGGILLFMSVTPSDHRAIKNALALLRKAGWHGA